MSDAPDFEYRDQKQQGDSAVPRFYTEAQHNQRRSDEDGVPRFDEVEKVEILIPGDRKTTWDGIVNEQHRRRWPRQYAAFKEGLDPLTTGTPIREMPGITKSQAEELAYQHIHSIETLAGLTDDQAAKAVTMGGLALRDRAKRYIDAMAGDAASEKLAAENRELKDKMALLEGQMADVLKRMADQPQVAGAQPAVAPPVA